MNYREERIKHAERLNQLIEEGADYEDILEESKILDEYIIQEMRTINRS